MSSTQEVGEIFGQGAGPAHAMLRSPTVLIAAIGLWGMNIYFYRLFGIDYIKVLKHDLYKLANEEMERHYAAKSKTEGSTDELQLDETSDLDDENEDEDETESSFNTSSKDFPKASGNVAPAVAPTKSEGSLPPAPILDSYNLSDEEEMHVANPSYMNVSNGNLSALEDAEASIMGDATTSTVDKPAPSIFSYTAITWGRLVGLSMSLLFVLHSTYFVWIDILKGGSIGAVYCFYGAVAAFVLFPVRSTAWLRKSAKIIMVRIRELVTLRCWCCRISAASVQRPNGPRAIPFVDVFFADALCSLSKVFFDWGMLLHMAYYYPHPVPQSTNNILIPSAFAAVPYLIRARQCIIMYAVTRLKNDPGRFQHLWNALKYSTSLYPLILSAYQKTVSPAKAEELEIYLILLLAINASYSLFWDIVMDWGMMKNPVAAVSMVSGSCTGGFKKLPQHNQPSRSCWYTLLRNRLRYGVAMSVLILFVDAVLRFSWTLRFYHNLFPSGDSFVLCTQFLEVFRRGLWNLLRVEWENLKQAGSPVVVPSRSFRSHHHHSGSNGHIQFTTLTAPHKDDEEKARLLLQRSNAHVVPSNKVKP